VVTTPEPTSLTDAYSLLKATKHFKIKSKASDPASTYYTVMWYDAAGKTIAVEDKYHGDISPKEECEISAYPPKQEYGPVSYKLAVRAYSKVYPTPNLDNFDIPHVKD